MRVAGQAVERLLNRSDIKFQAGVQAKSRQNLFMSPNFGEASDAFVRIPRFGKGETSPTQLWPYGASWTRQSAAPTWRFKLWAPRAQEVELLLLRPPANPQETLEQRVVKALPAEKQTDNASFTVSFPSGDKAQPLLYMYRLTYPDGSKSKLLPDPRSRYQPEDVHGPSQTLGTGGLAPKSYKWQMKNFQPVADRRKLSIYELHIGTMTAEGTFQSAVSRLKDIKDAGFNTIEIMPVKEFPGRRNWGYDMVDFFAVENSYGRPEDLKKLVDEAHKAGLTVLLDVVYNHVGPEGNYFESFDQGFFSKTPSPWGQSFNWENPQVRQFALDNLSMWLKEFRVDGFRFDMTHYIPDPMLRLMTGHVQKVNPKAILIAEDGRSSNHVTLPLEHGGLGFWGKWNFDYHHHSKSTSMGKSHMNAPMDAASLAKLLERGFQPHEAPMNSLFDGVNFYESHDEIGNHDGRRAIQKVSRNRFLTASLLKYLTPGIPMAFMGEEYGETRPFYFFCDYTDPAIKAGLREGRKNSPQPDALDEQTFLHSKLSSEKDWALERLNRDLLNLRNALPALWQGDRSEMKIDQRYLGSGVLVLHRRGKENPEDEVVIMANLGDAMYPGNYQVDLPTGAWREVLNSDSAQYGGSNLTNKGKLFEKTAQVAMAPWSITILHKA